MIFGFVSSISELGIGEELRMTIEGTPEFFSFYNCTHLWIMILHTVNIIVNDLVLFLITLIIDLLLVVHIRKELSKKKRILISIHETSGLGKSKKLKKLQQIKNSHEDTNKMVVSSLVLFLICRLPELTFEAHLLFLSFKSSNYTYE